MVDKRSFKKSPIFSLCLKIGDEMNGGAMENRTPDLRVANATLYQLSYDPNREALGVKRLMRHSKRKAIASAASA